MFKNKTVATLLVTSLLAGLAGTMPTNVFAKEMPKDLNQIKSDGAKQAVKYLFEKDKLNGYADNTFKPHNDITRAEFVTMVLNSLELEKKTDVKEVVFHDSTPGKWHYENLKKAYSYGLISGKGVSKAGAVILSPNDMITREEMITVLVRAHEYKFGTVSISQTEMDSIISKFKDKDKLPKWSKSSVAKAVKSNITYGVGENEFGAGEKGTRLQSAVFSYRLVKEFEKVVVERPGETKPGEETPVTPEMPTNPETPVTPETPDKPGEETPVTPELLEDVVYLSDSYQTVAGGRNNLVDRFKVTSDKIHFVKEQGLDNGAAPTPVDYKIQDVEKLTVVVNTGVKVNPSDDFPVKTLYLLNVDDKATSITVDPVNRVITANKNETLRAIKNAFEVTSAGVLGVNKVDFYSEFKDDVLVNGGMSVLIENSQKVLTHKLTKFSFADSLAITKERDTLLVKGLTFEDMLDLYKLNGETKLWEKVSEKSGAEVKVDGTYKFTGLSLGKYKVVEQPLEVKDPTEYTSIYNKRLLNENVYEVVPYLIAEINNEKKMRLINNYSSFAFENTNESANFFKDAVAVADIVGSGKLTASVVYENRTDRANMTAFNVKFGTENVNLDGDAGTPDTVYQTLELVGTPDYTEFTLGEKFKFTLVLEDKKEDGTVVSKTEVKYEVSVVLNADKNGLMLEYKVI